MEDQISNQVGTICVLERNSGLISFGREGAERAFFMRSSVAKTLLRPTEALSEVFRVGDIVCFNAQLNQNTHRQEKWRAVSVTTIQRSGCYSTVFDDFQSTTTTAVPARRCIPETVPKPTEAVSVTTIQRSRCYSTVFDDFQSTTTTAVPARRCIPETVPKPTEVFSAGNKAKMVDQINDLVKKQIQTTLQEVVPKVIEYLLDSQRAMIEGHSTQFLQGEGDGGSVAEPSGRQYSLVSGPAGSSAWQPSASQQRSVTAGPSPGASQTSWGEAVGQFGKQTLPRFISSFPSVLPKLQPEAVASPWQPSDAWQERRVAADLSRQASRRSLGVAVGQFGQPLSSFNSSPASIAPEVLPATVRPADGARPLGEVQRYASMLARDKCDPPRFRYLGISFDTPAAVEGGLSNVGAWHLDSSSAQQESGPGPSSWDYNPELRFPEAHSVLVGGLLEEPD